MGLALPESLYARALSSRATVDASLGLARMAIAEGIPGDFVECGVFAGAQAAAMAYAIMEAGIVDRRVHLFDSFVGVPAAGEHDHTWRQAHGDQAGVSAQTFDQVWSHMEEWGVPFHLLWFHVGWFQEIVPDAVTNGLIERIAVLRLDADLYESTQVCIDHLYPLVSPGGWIIADDYGLDGCRRAINQALADAPIYWRK